MLYLLLYPFHDRFGFLNVFRYITFRTAMATVTALAISLLLGEWMIGQLRALQVKQVVRDEGPKSHRAKSGTPTMGGVLILFSLLVPTLLWADIRNFYVLILCGITATFGLIGFLDDYLKVVRHQNLGLRAKQKLTLQIGAATLFGWLLLLHPAPNVTVLTFPFFKNFAPDIGWMYLPFIVLTIVFASNAVNLTDGLDGLAIGATLIASGTYAILTYVVGHAIVANYLLITHVPGAGELSVFCGALVGSSLGFLWFNAHPAEVFMGDVGSLALGAAIGTIAVIIKQEFLLVLVGGLFVAEAVSVILQVASFKLTGKRIFKMAPLHHHFELLGWRESKIITRFWIVAIVFSLFALSTLKLR